jgi:acetyl-CoA acyltransferase
VPLTVAIEDLDAKGRKQTRTMTFDTDEGVRRDSSEEGLAKTQARVPHERFGHGGQLFSDVRRRGGGRHHVEDRARELNLTPLARFVAYATAGCAPEEMGIGPVNAIPKALQMAGLTIDDIGVIELNEAFAAQSLAVIKALGLDPDKINVNGGAIALGHPLGCTGAKLTATILREMKRRESRYGMVTMCVGGGMGAAGIFELMS